MCQSLAQGGKRCAGHGSVYPSHALEQSLMSPDGTVEDPTTPEQALHVVALVSQGKSLSEDAKNAAREFDITTLSPQQKWQTFGSLALSESPSKGLKMLHELGFEQHFPDLHAIRGVPQSEYWHPEGSVEKHIQEAGDVAARISKEQKLSKKDTQVAVLGAICHDFGKSTHTQIDEETGKITSYGHDKSGAPKAKAFLEQIGADEAVKTEIPPIVAEHMCHIQEPTHKSALKLDNRLKEKGTTLEAWTRVADSDIGGRGSASEPSLAQKWIRMRDEGLAKANDKGKGKSNSHGLINGKFLGSIGFQPGPRYRELITAGHKAMAEGKFSDEAGAEKWYKENF